MTAKRIAITLSDEALRAVDRYARAEGISRGAWFERAARGAKRRAAAQKALQELGQAIARCGRGQAATRARVDVTPPDIEDFARLANHYPGLRVLRV